MGFRFLHAADLHLDTPFTGLGATSPQVAQALRDASLLAFDDLVRTAIARDVAFVVLSGDVYDGPERGIRAQLRVLRGVTRLAERGIATFIAAGNHDPVEEGWSAVREWPDLVTVFPAGEVVSVPVERDGRVLATVHGTSYARRATTENLAVRFRRTDAPGVHVGVLHANVGGRPGHDPYSPCTVDDLVRTGLDYWALGHVHTREVLHRDPWIVYPGNLQGRSPRPGERGAKGVLIVEVDDAGTIGEPELVALDRVRIDDATCEIDELADLGELHTRLRELGQQRLLAAEGRSLLLGVRLVGRGALHADLRRPGAAAELLQVLRDDAPLDPPFLWWDRLDVATTTPHDLDELRQRNDFVADLLEESTAMDEARRTALSEEWAAELPADLSALLGDERPDPTAAARWQEAVRLAVDLVVEED
ncbi:metallophosphoesterase family protein [Actinomarinicola tropica]|uniref:metallophosphoesterase family protein n=1 Tax=Actinomarinicola tropica TaxID=2789776 RepID=UPI001898FA4B|nr:DNA repair exonuclease [Actinomarinicola tropica]